MMGRDRVRVTIRELDLGIARSDRLHQLYGLNQGVSFPSNMTAVWDGSTCLKQDVWEINAGYGDSLEV